MNNAEMIRDSFYIKNGMVEFLTSSGGNNGSACIPIHLFGNFIEKLEDFVESDDDVFTEDHHQFISCDPYHCVYSILNIRRTDKGFRVATAKGGSVKPFHISYPQITEVLCQLKNNLDDLVDEGLIPNPFAIPEITVVTAIEFDNGEG